MAQTGETTHRAAILADAVCEAAVAFGSDLNIVGALEKQSLLQVAGGGVHVGNAVLAVVCDVLGGLVGHQAHEGHLDADVLWISSIGAILELCGLPEGQRLSNAPWDCFSHIGHFFSHFLTWNPPDMDSLNQTCFFSLAFLLRYQFFMGMLDSLGEMQVSPVSMLQWTLMASRADPWLGSIQYTPVAERPNNFNLTSSWP